MSAPARPRPGADPAPAAVSFRDVSIVFGNAPARALPLADAGRSRAEIQAETGQILGVHDCTLDVGTGEIVVLMGLSGSGKSTLLRAVNGLNPVTRGQVVVRDGEWSCDVGAAKPEALRHLRRQCVAMVFQQFGLLPWRSVAENVGFGLELAGLSRRQRAEKVQAQLDLVGLSDWRDRRVGELSGGMQQRVGLARAFATEAPILLMDEPFSALDPLIRTHLQDELLTLQDKLQRTILFVSHDLDEAFRLGDRIAIMEGGRIVQSGRPRDIYTAPGDGYVADFVAHMNPLGVLTARDVMVPGVPAAPDGGTSGAESGGRTGSVAPDTPVREVMARLEAEAGLVVADGPDGPPLGHITRAHLLRRLRIPSNGSPKEE